MAFVGENSGLTIGAGSIGDIDIGTVSKPVTVDAGDLRRVRVGFGIIVAIAALDAVFYVVHLL